MEATLKPRRLQMLDSGWFCPQNMELTKYIGLAMMHRKQKMVEARMQMSTRDSE